MPFGIQPIHIIVVLIVALVIFGPKRLPQIGRWIGRTFMEFRKGAREMTESLKEEAAKPVGSEASSPGNGSPTGAGATAAGSPSGTGTPASSAAAEPNLRMGPYCTQCGASNPPDSRFCSKCGTRLLD